MKKLLTGMSLIVLSAFPLAYADESDQQKRIAQGKIHYDQVCLKCHDIGVDSAPKIGYVDDWKVIKHYGEDALLESIIKGKGMMPPRAGSAEGSEERYRLMLEYMLSTVDANGIKTSPAAKRAADRARHLSNGETLYNMVCANCHTEGMLAAPKIGDKAAWEPRLTKGYDALVTNVSTTHGGMIRVGGSAIQSLEGVRAMVSYMLSTVEDKGVAGKK